MLRISCLVFFTLLTACVARSPYLAPAKVQSFEAPPEDKARIVFIRIHQYLNRMEAPIIDAQGNFVGATLGGTKFSILVPPGEHTFINWGGDHEALRIHAEAGKTYYVEVAIAYAFVGAHVHMYGIKPSRPNWRRLDAWLADTTTHQVLTKKGQERVDGAAESVKRSIARGLKNFAAYSPEEQRKRSLAAADGR